MEMNVITDDLVQCAINGYFDVIIHGCNCFHTMGAGIAKQIKKEFPEAYKADKENSLYGDRDKLGKYTCARIIRGNVAFDVINAYTQYRWSRISKQVDYDAIRNIFKLIKINYTGKRIGFPMIGCSLAGGDWNIVSAIIDEELEGENYTLVKWNGTVDGKYNK